MKDKIQFQVITSTDIDVKATVKEVYFPAYLGKAGVLENHKPYITLLKPGEIAYKDIYDKKFYLYVKEGFLEVIDNNISIISDSVEKGEMLNKEEIETKFAELNKRIKSSLEGKITPEELEESLEEQREYEIKRKIIQKIEERK